MNKPFSPSKCLDEVNLHKQYSVKLMPHQEEPVYQLVNKINKIIANSSTPTRMLQDLAKVIGVAFQVDGCSLVTVSSEVSSETITASWCAEENLELSGAEDEMFSTEQHLDVAVIECASERFTIEDIPTIQKCLAIGRQSLPPTIKAVLAIPTRFGGKNNGVISLIKSQPYVWRESQKQLLKAVESCCAIAFSQVAQAQQIADQNQYLRTCVQHQSLIKRLTIISRTNLEINQMLRLALASTAEALEADRGLLILLKYTDPLFRNRRQQQIPQAKASVVAQWNGTTETPLINQLDISQISFSLRDCGLCQRAFVNSGNPLIIDDTDLKDTLTVNPVFAIEALPVVLLMPLEIQGKVLGFLVLQQAVARDWQATELNIVQMVCAQLSNAIIQTQTLRQVQTLVDERTAQLQRSLEVQARLYEVKRQQTEQLQKLNDLKDEFLSNISDRLRHPLTRISVAIRNLRQMGQLNERQTKYAHMIEQDCTDEIHLINDLLKLQELATHNERPQLETTDLNTRIRDLSATFEAKLADKGISLSLDFPDSPLTVQTERESFDRILQELLTNASKYSEHDTVVHLQVTHQVNQEVDQVIIQVNNIGRGISEEEASYIFDRFRRGKGRWTPGAGLGLALVKSLVQHLNGTITVESTPIEDSSFSTICFTLTLPQFSDKNDS
ncbi:GAF domain-containing sensor histidine kinase [Brasilonema octagenarum]|jgi:signal transduction histidine kinase|uniref:histidine kinase n=1 Tax=Brasilonema octagenarum UFV-OR1 TaxID=417115 RepID=A0ABX1MDG4_9CYAN|nr:GAF domain-containing sensor histidine kinase [Brasilonema octagenarum]NMF66682.1 sensor histidine kinase [Brasilonema octagenarum UFV-OR1]